MEPIIKNRNTAKETGLKTAREALSVRTHGVATIGLFSLLLVLLIGLYFWITAEKQIPTAPIPSRPTYDTNREPESVNAQAEVGTLQVLSTSNELSAIEADLLSTDLSSLEKELTQIKEELR